MNSKRLYFYHWVCKFIPPTRGYSLKAKLLRWCGAKIGYNVRVVSSARIIGDYNLIIGDNTFIGHEALIFGPAHSTITIGANCIIGSRVILVTGTHDFTPDGPCIEGKGTYANITIEPGVAISTGSIVLPGKTVHKKSHIAAGSVITHDVPQYCRVAGVPARVIKEFDHKEDKCEL